MVQKILVLDDEENYAEMLKTLLEQHRFAVDTVTRTEAAIEALQKDGHELVISDFKMPVMDGASFLEKARQVNSDLPFILVSGLMNTPELVKVANMGVTMVLEKPIDVDVFIDNVKRFVKPLTEEAFEIYRRANEQPMDPDPQKSGEARLELTYPKNLQYLSGYSSKMQRFLEGMWQALQNGENLFVSFFPEAELELVLREIAVWQDRPPHSVQLFHASAVGTTEFAEKLQTEQKNSGIVGILGFAALDDYQQKNVLDFIAAPQSIVAEAESLTVVHFIEEHLLLNPIHGYSEALLDVFRKYACRLPSFAEKPADLAAYIRRYLDLFAVKEGLKGKVQIEPEAVDLLLNYGWPRNFGEMISVLRRAVLLGRDGPLTAHEMAVILKRTGVFAPDVTNGQKLADTLLNKQSEYLRELMKNESHDLPSLLTKVGAEGITAGGVDSIDELGLLFPDLLSSKTHRDN